MFPDEDINMVLKRELSSLKICDYLETVKDIKVPNRSDWRVFIKKYKEEYVYIKIRVEAISADLGYGENIIFVMSFHFSTMGHVEPDFHYL